MAFFTVVVPVVVPVDIAITEQYDNVCHPLAITAIAQGQQLKQWEIAFWEKGKSRNES